MKATFYARWEPHKTAIRRLDTGLTAAVYAAYPLLILWQWRRAGEIPLRLLWVPASWLVLVSLLRRLINRPRPYESGGFPPLLPKHSSGCSFPSRHAFSVFIIAATAWEVWPPAGVGLGIVGVGLCAVRVIGGVHYPSDVAVGAAIGLAAGALNYHLLWP